MKNTYLIILITFIILILGALLINRLPHIQEYNDHMIHDVYGQ